MKKLKAGAAVVDITPQKPYFLFGYPFAERTGTGVHDPLLSSALYLSDGNQQVIFIANDVIYVSKASVARIRLAVSAKTGVPSGHILVAATHTHSGPVTVDCIVSSNDPVVPKADPEYLAYMEKGSINAACEAFRKASLAEIGFAVADGTGTGTNRHDPSGPADMEIPVLHLRKPDKGSIAYMLVCNMHPTVLHEDSTLYSSDFPAFTRETIQKNVPDCACPVIYFTGAAGNQSPRHVTRNNTFDEARRIGGIIAGSIGKTLWGKSDYYTTIHVSCHQLFTDLPRRSFPSVEWAELNLKKALDHLETLKRTGENHRQIRTAEVDWFGARELLSLSVLAGSDTLEEVYRKCLPAEIQIIRIGEWCFVTWPGEIFVEYELELKSKYPHVYMITLANGELQGYIVTEEAGEKGYYEASNSVFDLSAGKVLMVKTMQYLLSINK